MTGSTSKTECSKSFFSDPPFDWARQYEALRAYVYEGLTAAQVAARLGYDEAYVRLLAHRFRRGLLPWQQGQWHPALEGALTPDMLQDRVRALREQGLSIDEIAERLAGEGAVLSARTVSRMLGKLGLSRMTRRSRAQRQAVRLGTAGIGTEPGSAAPVMSAEGEPIATDRAGLLLFLPALPVLNLGRLAAEAGWLPGPGWSAGQCLEALLLAKLAGWSETYFGQDQGPGRLLRLLSGLPRVDSAALARYVWSIGERGMHALQEALIRRRRELGLFAEQALSLARHRLPDLRQEEAGEGMRMARVITPVWLLRALDVDNGYPLLGAWPERRGLDPVDEILAGWPPIPEGPSRLLIVGPRLLSYGDLARLDRTGMRFITLRRRGEQMLSELRQSSVWKRASIAFGLSGWKGRLQESRVELPGFTREVRQIAFDSDKDADTVQVLLTNDWAREPEEIIHDVLTHERLPRKPLAGRHTAEGDAQRSRAAVGQGEGAALPGLRAWLAPLALDLTLMQAAKTAWGILTKSWPQAVTGSGILDYQTLVCERGRLNISKGRLTLEVKSLPLYRSLCSLKGAGAYESCGAIPSEGVAFHLV